MCNYCEAIIFSFQTLINKIKDRRVGYNTWRQKLISFGLFGLIISLILAPGFYFLFKSNPEILNPLKGEILNPLKGVRMVLVNDYPVSALSVLENGDIVSASQNSTIQIFESNNVTAKVTIKKAHGEFGISALAQLPYDNFATADWFGNIKIWNSAGNCIRNITGHTISVRALIALPNGDLASGSTDETIKIWDVDTGELKKTLEDKNQSNSFTSLSVLKNGYLASGTSVSNITKDGNIKIWNTTDGSLIKRLKGHSEIFWGHIQSLTVLPNGYLVSGAYSLDIDNIRIWNVESGENICRFPNSNQFTIKTLVAFPNGQFASSSLNDIIKIWDSNRCTLLKTLNGHSDSVMGLAVLKDGDLVSGSYDRKIIIWDLNNNKAPIPIAEFPCSNSFNKTNNQTETGITICSNGKPKDGKYAYFCADSISNSEDLNIIIGNSTISSLIKNSRNVAITTISSCSGTYYIEDLNEIEVFASGSSSGYVFGS